jgi:hypothetical protein
MVFNSFLRYNDNSKQWEKLKLLVSYCVNRYAKPDVLASYDTYFGYYLKLYSLSLKCCNSKISHIS